MQSFSPVYSPIKMESKHSIFADTSNMDKKPSRPKYETPVSYRPISSGISPPCSPPGRRRRLCTPIEAESIPDFFPSHLSIISDDLPAPDLDSAVSTGRADMIHSAPSMSHNSLRLKSRSVFSQFNETRGFSNSNNPITSTEGLMDVIPPPPLFVLPEPIDQQEVASQKTAEGKTPEPEKRVSFSSAPVQKSFFAKSA